MAITKEQKKKIIEELKEKLEKQKAIVFVDFQNLKASNLFELRRKLEEKDCELKVAKKTLMNLAFKEKGFKVDFEKLEGQLALVFSFKEEILPAKMVYEFAKKFEGPKILGGYMKDEFLQANTMIELAKLPSKEELLARLVGSLRAPISNFQMLLKEPSQRLIFALKAIK